AFLFGTSVYIFLTRLRAKDRSTWVYVRRMVILVIAGLINSSLGGIDVLASYGVLALVLLPLTFLSRRPFAILGILAAIVPALLFPPLSFSPHSGHMVTGFWLAESGRYSASSCVPVTGIFAISFIGSVPLWLCVNAAAIGSTDAHDIAYRTAMVPGFMYVTG